MGRGCERVCVVGFCICAGGVGGWRGGGALRFWYCRLRVKVVVVDWVAMCCRVLVFVLPSFVRTLIFFFLPYLSLHAVYSCRLFRTPQQEKRETEERRKKFRQQVRVKKSQEEGSLRRKGKVSFLSAFKLTHPPTHTFTHCFCTTLVGFWVDQLQ